MSVVDAARDHAADLFTQAGVPAEPDGSGGFTIAHGPTTVFVVLSEVDGRAAIEIWAPVLPEVALTPELYRFAAETSFLFGRLCVARTTEATGQLQLGHALLADPLDETILLASVGTVANTAADLATTLPERFPPPNA